MTLQRRTFLKQMASSSALLVPGMFPYHLFESGEVTKLTLLHTNDVHSRVEPFPDDGGRNAGRGGAAKRAQLISQIRQEEKHVILLDSGDIFQGTPYFNFFGGEIEFKLMSEMQYDVATMGNHDFDAGIEGFVKQLPHANFPFVVSNYDVNDSGLYGHVLPYVIKQYEDVKVGVFGIGIELEGLVPDKMCQGVVYNDPIAVSQNMANRLRNDYNCDYVICLSHLGYSYREDRMSDVILAANTSNIDLILGGHTHTFLEQVQIKKNKLQKPVFINQAGWGGMMVGRLDIYFENNKKTKCQTCKNLFVE